MPDWCYSFSAGQSLFSTLLSPMILPIQTKTTDSPCINYMQYPWRYAVPMRTCITRESYHQYPWVISSVRVKICSTRESYPRYPWVISCESYPQYVSVISSVPVSHILSTCEDVQYPWGISSVPMRICSTHESYPQYPWEYAVPLSHILWVISSVPVSHILSTCEDMQYPWVILERFEQASEIKCPKVVTKYQNDSKADFTGSPSETESDSDSAGGTKGEDKISASSVICSGKSS